MNKYRPALLILLSMTGISGEARSNTGEVILRGDGTVKDADALTDGVLFKIEYVHREKGGKAVSTQIRQFDLSGPLLVEENTQYDSLGRFKLYTMLQNQTDEQAKIEVKDEQVVMSFTAKGKTTVSSEPFTASTTAPGSLMAYMSGFTRDLENGQKVPVRLAVAERGMILGFEISPAPSNCRNSAGDLCVNLALSNFFLNKLFRPIFMSFQKSPQGYRPLAVETPALVRRLKGTSLEKFTARIDYRKF